MWKLLIYCLISFIHWTNSGNIFTYSGESLTLCVEYNTAPFIICLGCDYTDIRQRYSLVTVLGSLTFNLSSPCNLYSCNIINSPPVNYILYPLKNTVPPNIVGGFEIDRTNGTDYDNTTTTNSTVTYAPSVDINNWIYYNMYVKDIHFSDGFIVLATQLQSLSCANTFIVESAKPQLTSDNCCLSDENYGYVTDSPDCSIDNLFQYNYQVTDQMFPRSRFFNGSVRSYTPSDDTIIFPLDSVVIDNTGFNYVIAEMGYRSYSNSFTQIYVNNIGANDKITTIEILASYNPTRIQEDLDCLNFIKAGVQLGDTLTYDFDPFNSYMFLQNLNYTSNFVSNINENIDASRTEIQSLNISIQNITDQLPDLNLTDIINLEDVLQDTLRAMQQQIIDNTHNLKLYQSALGELFTFNPNEYTACVYAHFESFLIYCKIALFTIGIIGSCATQYGFKVYYYSAYKDRYSQDHNHITEYIFCRAFRALLEVKTLFVIGIGVVIGYIGYSLCLVQPFIPFRILSAIYQSSCERLIFGH